MQAHIGRIAAIEAMAIHTTLELRVLNQRTFIKRGEVAFVNTHLAPHLVAWLNQTVADAVVDAVRADVNRKRTVGVPTIGKLGGNGYTERVSTILTEQFMPIINVEVNRFFTLAVQVVPVAVCNNGINTQCFLISHAKFERSNIYGYGDPNVVRIYLWQLGLLLCIADLFVASDEKGRGKK